MKHNPIQVYCPHCKDHEPIKVTQRGFWMFVNCRSYLRDRRSNKFKGIDRLIEVLKDGRWQASEATRYPPKRSRDGLHILGG